jgi:hypothetical protein
MLIGKIKIEPPAYSATRVLTARSGPSNCARASNKSSADRMAAALGADPVAW